MIQMRSAADLDSASNAKGKPGLEKLRLFPSMMHKLKDDRFAGIFLDMQGLEYLNLFISPLPDGSWPLATVRDQLAKAILRLPVTVDHLKGSRIGKTLSFLQANKKVQQSTKNLIQLVKDKWSRIICNLTVDYSSLEDFERNVIHVPLYTHQYYSEDGSVV